jgi:hypothetical protein
MKEAGAAQSFVLTYSVKRSEIWRWYWARWAQWDGLWRYWLALGVLVFGITLWIRYAIVRTVGLLDIAIALSPIAILFGFFVVFPQMAYKPRPRRFTADANGIDTSIGELSAKRSWKDISSIYDQRDFIAAVVAGGISVGPFWIRTRTGNSFIIPNRAFRDARERQAFLDSIKFWHGKNALKFPRFSRTRYYADTTN